MPEPTLLIKGNLVATEWSPPQAELDQHRPIDYIMDFFAERLPSKYKGSSIVASSPADRILILESYTGSGKSTLLPPEFYHRFSETTRKNIGCTQPRVLTSVEIPKTILPFHTSEYLSTHGFKDRKELKMGDNIGYQTKVISKKPMRGIIYMTVGILPRQLHIMTEEDFMSKYSIIFLDEAHERSVGNDMALCAMKKFIQKHYKNPQCPFFVVMSATFNTKKFCDYLLSDVEAPKRYKNIIKVKGLTFPIKQHFIDYDSQNYVQSAIDKVVEIHQRQEDFADYHRDILIFVPGISDVRKIKKGVHELNSRHPFFQKYPIIPLELSSEVVANQTSDYKNAVSKQIEELNVEVYQEKKVSIKKPLRRVIIGTNVAETGITIATLKYVVDTGYHKSNEFNPNFAVELLITKPISLGMYKQRIGRVGRTAPGESYALYTQGIVDKLLVEQFPDIIKDDITLDLLGLIIKDMDIETPNLKTCFVREESGELTGFEKQIRAHDINIYNFDVLDLPSADGLHYAMEKLYILGAIDKNSIPTATGFLLNKFRSISVESARMILSGYAWKVSIVDLINIAAFLQYGQVFRADSEENWVKAVELGMYTLFDFEKDFPDYSYNKTNLFVMDDFLAFNLIFREFQKQLTNIKVHKFTSGSKTSKITILEEINNWCDKYGLSFAGLSKIIDTREEIIGSLAMMGLNPYAWNEHSLDNISPSLEDKSNYVKSIKMCIFEGYKMNIAVWNNHEKRYISRKSHLPLNITSNYISRRSDMIKYGDDNPKYIIYDRIMYLPNPKSNMYEANIENISVLDGYVVLDVNFDAIV
jgi:HrpA-like RNA helicase